ncbi:YitT family protein [Alkalihalobacterium bogoriense]|uniref:YitT family protein n=1 Tax=Alkalihalobacterium bogoriense TaxID=246272 RepID=UPI0009FEB2EB|nr:YitT family protein [Alkalihalobacterium bogoriense]
MKLVGFSKQECYRYFSLTVGGMIQGLAMGIFLFPHDIPSGGAAGLALLLNYGLLLPLGVALWLVNGLMLLFSVKIFGRWWTVRTMYAVTVTSVTVSVIPTFLSLGNMNLFYSLLVGALLFGMGVGILIRNGASSGGMVILALFIAKKKDYPPGKTMFWVNLFIFILTATVIKIDIVLYAIVCQWLSTKVIDGLQIVKVQTVSTHDA